MSMKSKERVGTTEYEYDISGMRRPISRPASIRSSPKNSVRSTRSRTKVQRKQSFETVHSRLSAASSASGSRFSGRFSRLIIEEPASLTNIPTELVHAIARYLPRPDLLNLGLTSHQLYTETIVLLYSKPYFVSTYRYAQFVTTVSHNPRLADLVRELDLSYISKLPKDSELAGWREWKHRTESLYSVYPGPDPDGGIAEGHHPLAHPLLKKYSTGSHDIPLGSLMHVVKSCPHLRYLHSYATLISRVINLNDLHISADYVILPSAPPPRWKPLLPSLHKPPTYHPTAFTNLLFISDVPKMNTWRSAELRTLRYEELVNAICSLEELEELSLRRAVWIKRLFAEEIVRRAGGEFGLRKVNFSDCGMNPTYQSWAKKFTARRNDSIRSLVIFHD